MEKLFRKILIRAGKLLPFLLTFVVLLGYAENLYSILTDRIAIDEYGFTYYYCPISNIISEIVAIEVLDVFLIFVLCYALELCKYTFRCAYYLALNLLVKFAVEHFYLSDYILIPLCIYMALYGLYCVYGGFKMIPQQKGKF